MPDNSAPSWLKIPVWLDDSAPGAAQAARTIATTPNLSDAQRERLQRLVSDTESAWRELPIRRHTDKRQLSVDERRNAQHELMTTAFYAAEFPVVGKKEIDSARERFETLANNAANLAREISETSVDLQLYGLWLDRFADFANELDLIADWFRRTAPLYKHEGPVEPVGRPTREGAHVTGVIRKLASVCETHFDVTHYGVVATLANASLDRTDIDEQFVRKSLGR